jgi:hypothetical protein
VRYICQNPPSVGFDQVAAHLGHPRVEGRATGQLGGTMTSVRAAHKRVGGELATPLSRDTGARLYLIDEKIAALLVQAFEVADQHPELLRP